MRVTVGGITSLQLLLSCGITYNGTPYYFIKNLQGDVTHITDADGKIGVQYNYDAFGKPTSTTVFDTAFNSIAYYNPFRYRNYYYDVETGLYYLQSRYYDPEVGRFICADSPEFATIGQTAIQTNLFAYCGNDSINGVDYSGYYWYQKYSGFKKTSVGFNVNVNSIFLSRPFCLSYAADFLKANGVKRWNGRTYSGMGQLRIAQELWFHAIVYYIGMPLKIVLKAVGISWNWLNSKVASARYMEINSNDNRAWIFSAFWWAGLAIKLAICNRISVPLKIITAIVI